jgi:hypothetical protein
MWNINEHQKPFQKWMHHFMFPWVISYMQFWPWHLLLNIL